MRKRIVTHVLVRLLPALFRRGQRLSGGGAVTGGTGGGRARTLLSAFLTARRLKLGPWQTLRHVLRAQAKPQPPAWRRSPGGW